MVRVILVVEDPTVLSIRAGTDASSHGEIQSENDRMSCKMDL